MGEGQGLTGCEGEGEVEEEEEEVVVCWSRHLDSGSSVCYRVIVVNFTQEVIPSTRQPGVDLALATSLK